MIFVVVAVCVLAGVGVGFTAGMAWATRHIVQIIAHMSPDQRLRIAKAVNRQPKESG